MNNKGETLVELIVSLALLALTVTMLATSFQASTGSFYNTIETKRELNSQVSRLTAEESVEKVRDLTIQYQYVTENGNYGDSFTVEMLRPVNGSLYKFR